MGDFRAKYQYAGFVGKTLGNGKNCRTTFPKCTIPNEHVLTLLTREIHSCEDMLNSFDILRQPVVKSMQNHSMQEDSDSSQQTTEKFDMSQQLSKDEKDETSDSEGAEEFPPPHKTHKSFSNMKTETNEVTDLHKKQNSMDSIVEHTLGNRKIDSLKNTLKMQRLNINLSHGHPLPLFNDETKTKPLTVSSKLRQEDPTTGTIELQPNFLPKFDETLFIQNNPVHGHELPVNLDHGRLLPNNSLQKKKNNLSTTTKQTENSSIKHSFFPKNDIPVIKSNPKTMGLPLIIKSNIQKQSKSVNTNSHAQTTNLNKNNISASTSKNNNRQDQRLKNFFSLPGLPQNPFKSLIGQNSNGDKSSNHVHEHMQSSSKFLINNDSLGDQTNESLEADDSNADNTNESFAQFSFSRGNLKNDAEQEKRTHRISDHFLILSKSLESDDSKGDSTNESVHHFLSASKFLENGDKIKSGVRSSDLDKPFQKLDFERDITNEDTDSQGDSTVEFQENSDSIELLPNNESSGDRTKHDSNQIFDSKRFQKTVASMQKTDNSKEDKTNESVDHFSISDEFFMNNDNNADKVNKDINQLLNLSKLRSINNFKQDRINKRVEHFRLLDKDFKSNNPRGRKPIKTNDHFKIADNRFKNVDSAEDITSENNDYFTQSDENDDDDTSKEESIELLDESIEGLLNSNSHQTEESSEVSEELRLLL